MSYAGVPQYKYTVEQEVQWGNCLIPPPFACTTQNNSYYVREAGVDVGRIDEDTSLLCRTCCYAGARQGKLNITIN